MNEPLDRVLRQEYIEEFWQSALNRCHKARSSVFYAAQVSKPTRAAKPVYRHRRFVTVLLYIPFQF